MKARYEWKKKSGPMPRDLSTTMRRIADYMVSSTQRKINSGIGPANAPLTKAVKQGNRTLRDRGGLVSSLAPRSTKLRSEVGTQKKYARIQQEGGTITAKKSFLYIPASAKARTMSRRFGATPTACIRSMKNNGYTVWRQGRTLRARKGKRGKPFTLFVLKKSVKIPARPFLHIDKQDEVVIMKMIENAVVGP